MSKSPRRRIVSWEESDAYSGWRKVLTRFQRAGAVKKVKRRTHKRERREAAQDIDTQQRTSVWFEHE